MTTDFVFNNFKLVMYVAVLARKAIDTNVVFGFCSATLIAEPDNYIFSWCPFLLALLIFSVFTSMSSYKIFQRLVQNEEYLDDAPQNLKSTLHSLRLVIYSVIIFASLVGMLYINGSFIFNDSEWKSVFEEYLVCLWWKDSIPELFESAFPLQDSCILDPENKLKITVYFMFGLVEIFLSVACLYFSCTDERRRGWMHLFGFREQVTHESAGSVHSLARNVVHKSNSSVNRVWNSSRKNEPDVSDEQMVHALRRMQSISSDVGMDGFAGPLPVRSNMTPVITPGPAIISISPSPPPNSDLFDNEPPAMIELL